MLCIICRQANMLDGLTSISFERDEFILLINQVPAQVCAACGEAVIDEEVTVRLLNIAEELVSEGIIEAVCDYSK